MGNEYTVALLEDLYLKLATEDPRRNVEYLELIEHVLIRLRMSEL